MDKGRRDISPHETIFRIDLTTSGVVQSIIHEAVERILYYYSYMFFKKSVRCLSNCTD